MRDCPGLAQQTIVVEAVGLAEPPQGIDVCRCSKLPSRRKRVDKRPTAHSDWPCRKPQHAARGLTALCFLPGRANELHAPSLRAYIWPFTSAFIGWAVMHLMLASTKEHLI